jgi:acyl carrier protein
MTTEIKTKIRQFLARFFQDLELADDQDIFALGFINSLFAMQLVLFVESEFGFKVEDSDLDIENFRTLNALASLIERKATAQTAA